MCNYEIVTRKFVGDAESVHGKSLKSEGRGKRECVIDQEGALRIFAISVGERL